MLEAPEALYYSEQLDNSLSGKTIVTALVGFTPHKFTFFSVPAADLQNSLEGKKIVASRSWGGMVELSFGEEILLFTDGVNFNYLSAGSPIPKKHQLLLGFSDDSFLAVSVRMYGGMLYYDEGDPKGRLSEYYISAKGKPQVMGDMFTQEYFLTIANDSGLADKSVKALLATNQNIPGLGNGVLQDILYNAKIHPKTKVSSLSTMQKEDLYRSVKTTLDEIYRNGGRSSETDIYGIPGRYVPFLQKDTAGHECPRCKEIIIKENYLGGSIYYCPGCQKKQ